MPDAQALTANAQLFDGAGTTLALLGVGYLVWGLISPRTAMFWARRWSRLWAIPLAAALFLMGVGMGVYAEQHEPQIMIIFGLGLIGLIAHTGALPEREPRLDVSRRPGAAGLAPPRETGAQTAITPADLPDKRTP